MDKLILSYENSVLYESDLEILKNETSWLNDRLISFYFEYIHKEIYDSNDDLLFIGSEVTQAIKMMENPDEITPIILEPLDAQNKSFIFFAINDNSSDQAGGSHWSLCIFSKPDNTFFHFDSSGYSNHFPCETLVNIMKKCLHCPKAELKKVDCLQQNNCYDCGIYVLCHADLASKTIMKSKSLAEVKKLQYKTITTKRSELIEIIKSFSSSN